VLGEYRAFVAALDEQRQSPRVIDVRMTDDDSINFIDGNGKRVAILCFSVAPALYQAAFEHDRMVGRPQQVKRTGYLFRRAKKLK
jgi:hypothetical protein